MTPGVLELTNFIGIRDGLGLNSITVDIASWGDGLIALTGPNGFGKSTLLDNMPPYRTMASRAGGYRPSQFNYYDETFGEASKKLSWFHEGAEYLSEILISNRRRETVCYLFKIAADGSKAPVALPDGTTSNGKTATYDQCVEWVLGTPELFFTSVFAAQGRQPIAQYKNADIKNMLAELMGQDRLQALSEKTNMVLRHLRGYYASVKDAPYQLASLGKERDRLTGEISTLVSTVEAHQQDVDTASKTLAEMNLAVALAEDAVRKSQETEARRDKLNERMVSIARDKKLALDELKEESDKIAKDSTRQETHLQNRRIDIRAQIDDKKAQKSRAAATLGMEKAITDAAEKLPSLLSEHEALQEQADQAQADVESNVRTKAKMVDASHKISTTNRTISSLDMLISSCQHRHDLISEVPCREQPKLVAECKLLEEARHSGDSIPGNEQAKQAATTALGALNSELADCEKEIIRDAEKRRLDLGHALTLLGDNLAETTELAAKLPLIQEAKTTLDAAVLEISNLDNKINVTDLLLDDVATEHRTVAAAIDKKISRVHDDTERQRQEILDDLGSLPSSGRKELAEARENKAAAFSAHNNALLALKQSNNRLSSLDGELTINKERCETKEKETAVAARMSTAITNWGNTARGLGPNGLLALLIDDAGPRISSLTNNLLLCYDSRYTVKIVTQEDTLSGTTKEVFDIIIFDAQTGESKSISKASGGQRVYVNEGVTRGIALYQSEISGCQYDTLFSDESDGSLDDEKKLGFMEMKRKVKDLGGYHREIFVTHTPALWDLADNQVDIRDLK